ncbi:MAG TPA: glycosyltransferase family 1 protein [Gemmatimonadaceae bacterium]|nr:glycosyltransferase family 1 protein [Gemmatimonadaceae bacterium]
MITVALDAQHTRHSSAGIARYATNLAQALRKRADLRIVELGGGDVVRRGTARKKLLTAQHDLIWYPFLARRRARDVRAQIYHSPLLRGPLRRGTPSFVMTVHDLVPIRYPETMPRWHRGYTSLALRQLLKSADRIIAPSQDTANDLMALLRVSSEKIRVIPNGVDAFFFGAPPQRSVADPYVLFVGTPEPRKNLKRLVEAVRAVRASGHVTRLVVVGAGGWDPGWNADPNFVSVLGRVSDEELHSLYAGARCVALPSLHEGFGLPALEAMAVGTPVVAGRSGALPEITDNAAILVDPYRVDDIANGIVSAIEQRDRLVPAGRERARQFSWSRAAELTESVYRELI